MNEGNAGRQEGDGAERSDDARRKPKQVLLDEIKEAHTSHWDMDVMPQEQLEALYARSRRQRRRHRALLASGVAGGVLALVCAGWLLLRLLA